MSTLPSIRVDIEAVKRKGTNKANRPYSIVAAYVYLPGYRYPQAIDFYTEQTFAVGSSLLVPLTAAVKDSRPAFELDFTAAEVMPLQAGKVANG